MLRFTVAFLASCCISLSAHAAPASAESINQLLKETRVEAILDQMFTQLDAMMKQGMAEGLRGQQITPEQQRFMDRSAEKTAKVIREELSWQKMQPLYQQIYSESFTQEEIDGLLAFYRSPAGKAFVDKMPVVMQKSMTLMQGRMGPMMQKIKAVVDETVAEAKAQAGKKK